MRHSLGNLMGGVWRMHSMLIHDTLVSVLLPPASVLSGLSQNLTRDSEHISQILACSRIHISLHRPMDLHSSVARTMKAIQWISFGACYSLHLRLFRSRRSLRSCPFLKVLSPWFLGRFLCFSGNPTMQMAESYPQRMIPKALFTVEPSLSQSIN